MLTIFATPRPFVDKFGLIQRNAIRSWKALGPKVEVILMGNDEGTAELAAELGLRHVPQVECNEYGTPLVSALFAAAERLASYDTIAYINADIILLEDFLEAVARVPQRPFLMVGLSWGLNLEEALDFSTDAWKSQLTSAIPQSGNRRSGADYFVFRRGAWREIPPLAVGRGGWDQWLIYGALAHGVPAIDASDATTVIHQNHDWSAVPGGEAWIWQGPEIKRNLELVGPHAITYSVKDATWRLTHRGLRPVISRRRFSRGVERFGERHPALSPFAGTLVRAMHPGSWLSRQTQQSNQA